MDSQSSDYVTGSEGSIRYSCPWFSGFFKGNNSSLPIEIASSRSNSGNSQGALARNILEEDDASSRNDTCNPSLPKNGASAAVGDPPFLSGVLPELSARKRGRGRPKKVSRNLVIRPTRRGDEPMPKRARGLPRKSPLPGEFVAVLAPVDNGCVIEDSKESTPHKRGRGRPQKYPLLGC